ncbi:MAG: FISUMP domain-containing protein [Bacteroidota bacterium]
MKRYYTLLLSLVLATVFFSACDNDDDDTPACELAFSATSLEAYVIEATATGGATPYRYAINGGDFQDNSTFEVEGTQDYTLVVQDANNCEATVTITAQNASSFTDPRDNNVYRTVRIGDQIWMAENLNYITDEGSKCYDDDAANCTADGRLYNWEAAQDAVPTGWKLPTEAEFQTLIDQYADATAAANALRPGGASDFEAQFAGVCGQSEVNITNDDCTDIDIGARYWTSDEDSEVVVEARIMTLRATGDVSLGANLKVFQYSVRCLKD